MNENQTLPSSEYSIVEWLGYKLWVLRPGIGSQLYHIKFIFLLEFATEFISLKIEWWLKRLTLSWKFNDQKFQQT